MKATNQKIADLLNGVSWREPLSVHETKSAFCLATSPSSHDNTHVARRNSSRNASAVVARDVPTEAETDQSRRNGQTEVYTDQ